MTNDAYKSNVTPLPASHSYNHSKQMVFTLNKFYFLSIRLREYNQRRSNIKVYYTTYCILQNILMDM
jgi:hypothetical protein